MKEVMQEIVLCGLSRAGFFKQAAFYGGTALRIFYGLDRFSEDLDFSLTASNPEFKLSDFFPVLEKEVNAYGLSLTVSDKEKAVKSNIQSAFLKGNTKQHWLMFYPKDDLSGSIAQNEVIKIKFEMDVDPPKYASFENKYRLLPIPYEVKLYDMPSLFAGKIHAVICRSWKTRIKGRDLYDYVFYLTQNTPVNIKHLRERLLQSEFIKDTDSCELSDIKKMLCDKFDAIDYAQARQDVEPFIKDISLTQLWSADFFKQITQNLNAI